jgi:hypothetical protein
MKIAHIFSTFFHIWILIGVLYAIGTKAFPCDLKRADNYLVYYENSLYIDKKEKERIIYRGLSMSKGDAVDLAFKEIKDKKCPDLKRLRR